MRTGTALLAAASILTGCQLLKSDPPPLDRWGGPVQDLRIQWSAADGIDLTEGPGVPIRAYMESRWLAQWQGSIDYAYPGYTEAVPPNEPDGNDIRAVSRRGEADNRVASPFFGNKSLRIMALNESTRDVNALVCDYSYTIAKEDQDGSFSSVARSQSGASAAIYTARVFLTAPETPAGLPPQQGPAPAPSVDVFGGWTITGFLNTFSQDRPGFAQVWPTYDADVAACAAAAPDSPERRAFLAEGQHPRDVFPTSPPSPGWPEPVSN